MRRLVMLAAIAVLQATVAPAAEVPRRVLALYKSSEGDSPARNMTASLLEQPLESLGLVVDYVDAEAALPSDAEMARYRGVLTFFREPAMRHAAAYGRWLRHQADAGRKVVIMGDYGALQDAGSGAYLSHAEVNEAFRALDLRFDGFGTTNPKLIGVVSQSPHFSYEEPFTPTQVNGYVKVTSLTPNATAYVTLRRSDVSDGVSQPVVVTPHGGFAGGVALLYEYRQGGLLKQRWHLNPHVFLAQALGAERSPRLDAASLNGRRLWIAHIDGDGFLSPTEDGRLCGQALLDDVLEPLSLPVAVSLISSDLDKDPRAVALGQAIFALPQVEPASHSRTHPLDWRSAGVHAAEEVAASVDELNRRVAPRDKPVRLIAWSGLSNPPAEALRAAESLGLANINGFNGEGGFVNRFDRSFPSRTHLAPSVRHVEGFLQFNHRAANDYEFTDEWSEGHRGRFQNVIETFQKTAENPERPAHVYFHFYSAATAEALEALLNVLHWSEQAPLSRVFVSDYVRLIDDFRSAQLTANAVGEVTVRNAGHCRTVVFPQDTRHVDMARSSGVVGYAHRFGDLYAFLDDQHTHVIALTDRPSAAWHLTAAGGWIDGWSAGDGRASFRWRAFGTNDISLAVPAGSYRITVRPLNRPAARAFTAVAESRDGVVTFRARASGHDAVTVERADRAGLWMSSLRRPVLAFSLAAFPLWFVVRARRRRFE